MRSDFWKAMQLFTTFSICTGIRFAEGFSSYFGFDPSQLGMPLQPLS
jgi:hypothetical protein